MTTEATTEAKPATEATPATTGPAPIKEGDVVEYHHTIGKWVDAKVAKVGADGRLDLISDDPLGDKGATFPTAGTEEGVRIGFWRRKPTA